MTRAASVRRLSLLASLLLPLVTATAAATAAAAQGTRADYERATGITQRLSPLIDGQPSQPVWLGDTHRFWYRASAEGGNEWRLVDAAAAEQRPLFDHARLAAALSEASGNSYTAAALPFAPGGAGFTVLDDLSAVEFVLQGFEWRCTLSDHRCERGEQATAGPGGGGPGRGGGAGGGGAAGQQGQQAQVRRSPDGRWEAFIQNYNVAVRPVEGGNARDFTMLSYDGSEGNFYTLGSLRWSPDSEKLMAYRRRPGYDRQIPYIESAPAGQLQPVASTRFYRKPGDELDFDQPVLFHVAERRQITIDRALFPNAYNLRFPAWRDDGRAFTFEYNERGHMNYRLLEVDAGTGAVRALVDERPETFFNYDGTRWRYDVDDGREILWMSERDGWKHIWLYDGVTGQVKNQVTRGEWVVRGVDSVDVAGRQIWFRASGMDEGRDPYLIHHFRVNFDGTGLVRFTEADGSHTLSWSPDREYYVATWSRVDQPPVMELRRTRDQARLMEVARTDVSRLEAAGWQRPEVFVAKGRDGVTDIWGVIIRPTNFDPSRSYPVIENIYAGPQGSFVPKTFSLQAGMLSLAEVGFIVVQIDGMGTYNRSKAFHDVAWKDLGDAGFPDRILWHQAVAARYPQSYDVSRVGIYGTSAGGQNSTGALLFHPEFYQVAVSAVGCHDNRMDKIWWNELWMSWPLGPQYEASSNVVNAHRLQGKLLLVVGELDTNVDPTSTLQVVDALIRADKDVDLLFIPGGGHGTGGAYGTRKRNDHFVRHLLGVDPPHWNAPSVATDASLEGGSANGGAGGAGELADHLTSHLADHLADEGLHDWLEVPASEQPPLAGEWG